MESNGVKVGAQNTDILHPGRKASVESDAYGGPKCSSNIFSNDEAKNTMGHTTVDVPVEESLADIGMKVINVVIHMECGGELSWVNSLGEIWPTQSMDKWVDWLTNPSSL